MLLSPPSEPCSHFIVNVRLPGLPQSTFVILASSPRYRGPEGTATWNELIEPEPNVEVPFFSLFPDRQTETETEGERPILAPNSRNGWLMVLLHADRQRYLGSSVSSPKDLSKSHVACTKHRRVLRGRQRSLSFNLLPKTINSGGTNATVSRVKAAVAGTSTVARLIEQVLPLFLERHNARRVTTVSDTYTV